MFGVNNDSVSSRFCVN